MLAEERGKKGSIQNDKAECAVDTEEVVQKYHYIVYNEHLKGSVHCTECVFQCTVNTKEIVYLLCTDSTVQGVC